MEELSSSFMAGVGLGVAPSSVLRGHGGPACIQPFELSGVLQLHGCDAFSAASELTPPLLIPRKKHWSASWSVLEGGVLTFFKDSKSSSAGGLVRPGS